MARHVVNDSFGTVSTGIDDRTGGPRWGLRVLAVVGLLVVAVGVAGVFVVGPRTAFAMLPFTGPSTCTPVNVDVSAAPAAAPVVRSAVVSIQGRSLGGGQCLQVSVTGQDPAQTVAGSAVLPADRAPDVWIPDSSLWIQQIPKWRLQRVGGLASTPVVLATSRQATESLGWASTPPTWAQALAGRRPLALPDLDQRADSLAAVIALWQSMGKDAGADRAVAAALIAAGRSPVPPGEDAVAVAQSGTVTAPLIATTEQSVFVANGGNPDPNLVAVYPREGSPVLDFPIATSQNVARTSEQHRALDLLLAHLTSPAAHQIAIRNGFRIDLATGPKAGGVRAEAVQAMAPPSAAEISGLRGRLQALAQPSRMLAVIDVSTSMAASGPGGVSRIQLCAKAAISGAELLPNESSVGLWIFARRLDGRRDWRELAPVTVLGSSAGGGHTHRDELKDTTESVVNQLTPGGTGLYDTALAAVRSQRDSYDPRAVNSVVIFTDGANDKNGGVSLGRLVSTLKEEADPNRPVLLFAMGIGPNADMSALDAMTEATGGKAWAVDTPADLEKALLEGLNRRPQEPVAGG
jgi:Ca-activated chloride channel family protein